MTDPIPADDLAEYLHAKAGHRAAALFGHLPDDGYEAIAMYGQVLAYHQAAALVEYVSREGFPEPAVGPDDYDRYIALSEALFGDKTDPEPTRDPTEAGFE